MSHTRSDSQGKRGTRNGTVDFLGTQPQQQSASTQREREHESYWVINDCVTWEFVKNEGVLLWGPYMKDPTFFEYIVGVLMFGNPL